MKKNIIYLAIAVFTLSACKKDGLVKYDIEKSFSDPAAKTEDFKKAIAAGTDGFKMIIETPTGGIFGGYIKFDGTSGSKFLLDNNIKNATTPLDNNYAIKVNATNSVLALGNNTPFGRFSTTTSGVDTTYSYRYTSGDTLKLVGDLLGTKLNLIKTTKKDGDEYLQGKMAVTMSAIDGLKTFKKYFTRLTTGGKSYDVKINTTNKLITFTYAAGTKFVSFSSKVAYTNTGLELRTPFVDGSTVVPSMNNFKIDLANSVATVSIGTSIATLSNESAPVNFDKTTAARFISAPLQGSWSESYTGFTINGVTDAFGVTTIPDFSSIDFYPRATTTYGAARFFTGPGYLGYFPALTTTVKDGKLIFNLLGFAGTAPNAAIRLIINNTTAVFAQPDGFYVIPTLTDGGAPAYDLVNVKDATAWINFQ